MRSCGTGWLIPQVICALFIATSALRALPGDADNSQDYPGFGRQHGYIISDYTEDNPAEGDFPVAHPLPLDANHVDMVHIRGHRFVIRYELPTGNPPSIYQTQLYYERLAASAGFQVAKSGAVGDVTETFCRTMSNHDIWISLEPSNNVNVFTVIEAPHGSTPIVPAPESVAVAPAPSPAPPPAEPAPAPAPAPPVTTSGRPPVPTSVTAIEIPVTPAPPKNPAVPAPTKTAPTAAAPVTPPAPASPTPADPSGELLYTSLVNAGRVIVPFAFQTGQDDFDAASQPEVDRIVAMMKKHADLSLRIEGHTDNSGDPDDNMRLSAQRAYTVRSRIIAGKIDGKRLDAVGVGGLQPIADNTTSAGRDKNRRVELVVWKRYSHKDAAPDSGD